MDSNSALSIGGPALDAAQGCFSEAGLDYLEALAGAASALRLSEVSSASLLLAALVTAAAAQAALDEEEHAYDLGQQLEVRTAAAAAQLSSISTAFTELGRAATLAAVEAEAHRRKAPEVLVKADKYRTQRAQQAQRLAELGYAPELSHGRLRALGQQCRELAGELAAAEAAARHYAGLPADARAAQAAHREGLQELARLQERLAAGLAGL